MIPMEHVNGQDRGNIRLYALSTCGWCARTKDLLRSSGVAFDFVFVDLLEGARQDEAIQEVMKYNPRGSFPTTVINNGQRTIAGFREDEIREALGL